MHKIHLTMRLTSQEKGLTVSGAKRYFGPGTGVILFGSRTNDHAQGRDIDLLLMPGAGTGNLFDLKIPYITFLKIKPDDQKTDVIDKYPSDKRNIVQTAITEGQRLCQRNIRYKSKMP